MGSGVLVRKMAWRYLHAVIVAGRATTPVSVPRLAPAPEHREQPAKPFTVCCDVAISAGPGSRSIIGDVTWRFIPVAKYAGTFRRRPLAGVETASHWLQCGAVGFGLAYVVGLRV